jgi:hypothetical protein
LGSIRDNTLYEESGSLSNGKGEYFFAGAIADEDATLRRGLVKFDIASNIPPNGIIVSATLRLFVSKNPSVHKPENFTLHRALSDWGEGTSDATGEEGPGTTATEGDATWLHSFYSPTPTQRIDWTNPGGDFMPAASASTVIDFQAIFYTWGPSPGMISDLTTWLQKPDQNYGWFVIGDESEKRTARRFDSRENGEPANRPVLFVEYAPIQGQVYLPVVFGGQ